MEHARAIRAQVGLNQALSGRISRSRLGIGWQIENLSTRTTCTIVVTESKSMGQQLVKVHLDCGSHAMVRLLEMVAQLSLQIGVAAEETVGAQIIHEQGICPNGAQVKAQESLFQLLA